MTIIRIIFLLVLWSTMATAAAERLPPYYPDSFPRIGAIDNIDPAAQRVIINDAAYYMSDNMVIHTRSNEFDTFDNLRRGATVGFRVIGAGTGQPLIPELWVLPASIGRSTE